MKLYYCAKTGRPSRVAWALEEIGADYETVCVAPEDRDSAEHRTRQPLGRVPAFEFDDGRMLFESTAIVLAIADAFPDAGLIGPLGSPLRAEVYSWSIFGMTELERTVLLATPQITRDAEEAFYTRQRAAFAAGCEAVAARLRDSEFLLGDAFTAADVVVGGVLAIGLFTGLLPEVAPEPVLGYAHRLQARPAYPRALDRTESLMPRP